jgi:hypothetical protein
MKMFRVPRTKAKHLTTIKPLKNKPVLYYIILVVTLVFIECHKPCNEPDYTFKTGEFFSPEVDSIKIGDTLWLQSIVPKLQEDINTQQQVDFSHAQNMGSTLIISDIYRFSNSDRGAIGKFEYFKKTGNIFSDPKLDSSGVKQLAYYETDSSYTLEIGMIAKDTGNYILTVTDNLGVYRKGETRCGVASFEIINQNNNRHQYLFENVIGTLSEYDTEHSYCIKVK